ncbi:hypothetical protein EJ03DRAFT_56551 [Teratosphaeria nubilosa]|uniref:Uncharacterized protein n=1 Tax=Teratosphaeria nubilosa TaxID=161662 RepID=A0A6G1LE00_9PEZI|nr:hypothetical protein EJ03DRAFT_56551 [Teratosphaeria nubilosa]
MQLNRTLQTLEKTISEDARPALTKSNVTGYASSGSSEDEPDIPDSDDLRKKFAVVGEVLERFSVRMDAHDRRQAEMAAEVNELRSYKEKSSALFSALKTELESPPADQDDIQNKQVVAVNSKVQALEENLTSFQRVFNGFLRATKHRVDTEEKIDGASTKDELYRLFKDLEKALWEEDYRGSCGIFKGGENELMALRGRLLRRLALFDGIGDALQEAQNADVDY